MQPIKKVESPYEANTWKIKIPPWKRKIQVVIEAVKENLKRVEWDWNKNNYNSKERRKDNSEILLKSIRNTARFLKYVRNTLWTTKFDLELLLWLLEKIKAENLEWTKKWNNYSINFHLDTLLDPRFFHYLKEVKKTSWVHKLNFLKIELLEEKTKKPLTTEKVKQLSSVIKKLQSEWVKIWLDDFPEWVNNKDFLNSLKENKVNINFIKLDWAKVIRFFTGKTIEWDPKTEEELTSYIKNIIDEIDPKRKNWWRDNFYITLEWITNEEALTWVKKELKNYVDNIQWYAVWMKEKI